MFRAIPVIAASVTMLFAVVLGVPNECRAQERGNNRDSLLGMLSDESIREEVGLTAEQATRLSELQSQGQGENLFRQFAERLKNAETEEQTDAVRAEMGRAREAARARAEDAVGVLLTPQQHEILARRIIRDRGAWALTSPTVQSSLKLTAEQIAAVDALQNQREAAAGQLGAGTPPKRFREFSKEWSEKPLAILTNEQRSRWDSAAAPLSEAVADAAATPAGANPEPAPAEPSTDDGAPSVPEGDDVARDEVPAPSADDPGYETDSETDDGRPVVSFGADEARPAADRETGERTLSFNFRYAPWSEVLRLFAEYSNLTLDLNQVPPGTFNYYDNRKYTSTEALDVLNGYLLQKGYILVRRDNFLVCLNIDDGIPPNLVPNITADELPSRGQNELLNVVFPIEGVSATDAAREVELLLGPQGKVVPLGTSNSLVVTDIGSNLRRINRLLSAVSAGPGDLVFKSYALKYLEPGDAEAVVKIQLGQTAGIRSVSSAYEDWQRDRDRDRGRDDRDSRSRSSSSSTNVASNTRVAADERTQSLLVTATAAEHRIVEEVLKATDVPSAELDRERARSNEPFLRVYKLNRSDPQEVVKTLDVLMPGVVVNEDGRSRKVHVHAPQAVQDEVERLIRQLDGEGTAGGSAVTVIPLVSLDPYAAATTIRSLFIADEEDAPVVEADSYGRRLLIRGTQDQVTQIRTLLTQLGEDGTGRAGGSYSTGPVRTIPLGGRDPAEMLPLLQKLWESSGDAPLRIVPTSPGSIIERRPLGAETTIEDRGPAANFNILDPVPAPQPAADASTEAASQKDAAAAEKPTAEGEDAATPGTDADPADADPADSEAPPVALTVQGGNLVLASEDEESLDRLEGLIQQLGQVIPPRTKWNVFYLRSADATETAMLIEQLFPTSSVSSASLGSTSMFGGLTSGLSSFGDNLMDASGLNSLGVDSQTLRIIPDVRSNSLFVSGPADKVAEIEQVLNVLDAPELPDSLRDRIPRMIEVRYADVDEVANILREVYKDYLQPANMAAMGSNPLAMLLAGGGGGGGRGDRDRREEPAGAIRLTIGVDSQTSRLIVSADDGLFRQIEELVASIDESAHEANRTVKVVSLENANAAMLQTTLGSLIPKVRTSSTADRRSTSTSSTSTSTPSSSSNGNNDANRGGGERSPEDQERIRRFFEDRMRERMQQGGGGDRSRGGDRGGDFRRSFGRDR